MDNNITNFLAQIGPEFKDFAADFEHLGFRTTMHLKFFKRSDFKKFVESPNFVQERILLSAIDRIQSPTTKKFLQEQESPASDQVKTDKGIGNLAPKQLNYQPQTEWESYSYTSPLEAHLQLEADDLDLKRSELYIAKGKLQKLKKEIPSFEKNSAEKVCTKCHMAAGHTKANCTSLECTVARQCGQLTRHPDQNKEIRQTEQ